MNMRHRISISLLILAVFTFFGCTDDLMYDNNSSSIVFDESDITDASLIVKVNEFKVSTKSSTRDEEPTTDSEIASDWEEQVDNIWVFQYDASTSQLLIKPRYYTKENSETNGTWTVVLKPNVASRIYVVTNVDNNTWASSYTDFYTIGDDASASTGLLKQSIPSPRPLIDLTEESVDGHIPMQGCNEEAEGITVISGTQVEVPVERMYAKVKMRVILDRMIIAENDAKVNNVNFENIPYYCRVSTLYDNEASKSQDGSYPSSGEYDWISRAVTENNLNDPNNKELPEGETTFDYVIYMPENIQGEESNDAKVDDEKADIAPTHASKMVVQLKYTNSEGVEDLKDYTVYPGGNNYNNFNIRRNQVYRVTVELGYPIEPDNEPSANCLVAKPGTTISFEPYYRVEEGGGYNFLDYISPSSSEGKGQQIKGIKILWQTKDCIGDNTDGSLVYFKPLKDGSEQTLHSLIYVTVNQPGNAVIAAYNDDNCEGDIIWSWHIWVTSGDPTNIASAIVYYTYNWDKTTIYSHEYYENLGQNDVRVPGYGCMPCNLGALASTPDSEQDQKVFGMNYQWGRKDPFPPLNVGDRNHGSGTSCIEYSVANVQQLYDNEHQPTIQMTAKEGTDEMFRSISGNTIVANPESYGVEYTIAHPTHFMCGAYYAGDLNFEYAESAEGGYAYGNANAYHNAGDWLPEGYSDNKLWGAIDPSTDPSIKSYQISSSIHLYDDYGEKSIFDPCPYGWRVSPPDQWLGFAKNGKSISEFTDINTVTTVEKQNFGHGLLLYIQDWQGGATSFFPTPGPRIGNGCGFRQYSCGNYHNASADDSNRVNILHVHDTAVNFSIFETGYGYTRKSVAGPVRCVRDTK